MTEDPVSLLVQEVDELLDASSVGLYEFRWILSGAKVPGSKDDHYGYARQALESLLGDPHNRLVLLRWAHPDYLAEMDREARAADFGDQELETPYVAITRD